MEALGYFLTPWLDPKLLFLVAAGTFAGVYVGAIPGLSVTMAVSILIGFTFTWDVYPALCLMESGLHREPTFLLLERSILHLFRALSTPGG